MAEGEFSNIKHNPIPVAIELGKEVQGKMLRLVVTKTVDDATEIVLGDLSIN